MGQEGWGGEGEGKEAGMKGEEMVAIKAHHSINYQHSAEVIS